MREMRGKISGDIEVNEPCTLWGAVAGNVTVLARGKFYIRGNIYGNLIVQPGGRVHIFGNVTGDLSLDRDTKVILSGTIGGNANNNGGRLFIDRIGKVMGRVRTKNGKTSYNE